MQLQGAHIFNATAARTKPVEIAEPASRRSSSYIHHPARVHSLLGITVRAESYSQIMDCRKGVELLLVCVMQKQTE